jgi:L-alanine-DL-glutamate epimerase-like enolase superfamily enzyme
LNAFQRRAEFVEFNTSQGPLSRELVKEPPTLVDGYVQVPCGPGLGVEVDEAALEKYRVQ